MISNCQPSLRAMASAFGTLGVSMKPKRSVTREKVALISSSRTRSRVDPRRRRGLDGEDDVLLVQHLVVLQTVHQRGRRAARIAGQKHGGARHALRRPLFQHRHQIGQRNFELARSSRTEAGCRAATCTSAASRRRRAPAAPSRLRKPSAGWLPRKVRSRSRNGAISAAAAIGDHCQTFQITTNAIIAVTTIVPVTEMP